MKVTEFLRLFHNLSRNSAWRLRYENDQSRRQETPDSVSAGLAKLT